MARYALIIGIAEYTGHFPSLETPVQNANAIADLLDRYGDFNLVRRLPSRREAGQKDLGTVIRKPLPNALLVRGLQQFLQEADGSEVLIYYSGHGFTKLDPLSQTSEGYLAPSDCQVELNADGQIAAEKNGISLNGLNALINKHKFSSLVVILDCCNSGAFLESGVVQRNVTAFGYQRDYYLITACRAERQAYEGNGYSLLTAAVLKGLSPENASPASGWVSGDSLFDVIGNELQNSPQEPLRMGWGRLIKLVKYQQQPESAAEIVHPFKAENPYMGLKPFGQEQAAYFFGREQAVRALLDRLAENRFLAVIGPSGCGKSSLVKAGLLPQLEGDRIPGSRDWQVEIITPGGQYPLQVLTNVLERHHSNEKPVVLFVDQFEELFTLCPHEDDQRTFIKRLNEETNDPTRQTRIIVAMRGDFLDRCAKFQEAADLINSTAPTTYMVIPLTEARLVGDLEDSITCPAALHGVTFEQGLVSRIVDDVVNQPGAMPLLQYALLQLWDNCIAPDRPSRQLTLHSYEAIDGVKGALQRWADQFYTNLSPTDQAFVRELISELVQIGDGNEVTRRRATWERLRSIASQEQLDRIIGRLIYQRLLVADDNTVEVAHEALLSESKLIQGWIEENRDSIRLQQRLEIYRHEWQEHDRSENYLLDAGRLAAIDEWMAKKQPRLMPDDQVFIENSRERRDRHFQAQLEQERQLREEAEGRELAEIEKKIEAEARVEAESERTKEAIARVKAEKRGKRFAIAACTLGVFTFSLGSLVQLRQSEVKQQQFLTVGAMIGKAEQLLETHNELEALEASVEALAKLREMGRENSAELQRIQKVISNVRERDRIVQAHKGRASGLSVSPDGKILVSGGKDGSIRIWKLDSNQFSPPIQKHTDRVSSIKFSSDGKRFATASSDGTVKIWNTQGNVIHSFNYGNYVYDVSFSASNQKIAASGYENGVIIWDIASQRTLRRIIKKDYLTKQNSIAISALDFHPTDENILVTVAPEKEADIVLWNLKLPKLTPKYVGKPQSGNTFSVTFNPQGNMIASCDDDGNINLRDINGKLIGRLTDSSNSFFYVEFSLDGKLIASVGDDTKIKLWEINELIETQRLKKIVPSIPAETVSVNTGIVERISFLKQNFDASRVQGVALASTDEGGAVRIWQVLQKKPTAINSSNVLIDKTCAILMKSSLMTQKYSASLRVCKSQ